MDASWEIVAQFGFGGLCLITVWWELRQQRIERKADAEETRQVITRQGDAIDALTTSLTALLERARMNDEDRTPPLGYRKPTTPKHGTDIVRPPLFRKRTSSEE